MPPLELPLPVETFARISVQLEESSAPRAEVLAGHGIDDVRWGEVRGRMTRVLAEEAMAGGATPLGDAFAAAMAEARDAAGPVPEMSVEAWAELVLDVAGRGVTAALAERRLPEPSYFRLTRHWTRALAGDKHLARRYAKAFSRAARAGH
ncbi:MAG: hypothetical protein WKG00_25375 [Polyangiaceae bacterium]